MASYDVLAAHGRQDLPKAASLSLSVCAQKSSSASAQNQCICRGHCQPAPIPGQDKEKTFKHGTADRQLSANFFTVVSRILRFAFLTKLIKKLMQIENFIAFIDFFYHSQVLQDIKSSTGRNW